jgi:hypothetical protein
MSIGGAPKFFAGAAGGVAGCAIIATKLFTPPQHTPRSMLHQVSSNVGTIYAVGIISFSSALSAFNRQVVLDAMHARPLDIKTIMRDAGGRAGSRTAITFLMLGTMLDTVLNSNDLPMWLRLQASIPMALFVVIASLPAIGVSYLGGRLVGSAIGSRLLLRQSLNSGKASERLASMFLHNPIAARVLVGGSAALALVPSFLDSEQDRAEGGRLSRHWSHWSGDSSEDSTGVLFHRSFRFSTGDGDQSGGGVQGGEREASSFSEGVVRPPPITFFHRDEEGEEDADLPVQYRNPHRHRRGYATDRDDDDDGGGGVDI